MPDPGRLVDVAPDDPRRVLAPAEPRARRVRPGHVLHRPRLRHLTPLVPAAALRRAGTTVCEPVHAFRLEIPADALDAVLPVLVREEGVPRAHVVRGPLAVLDGDVPTAKVHGLRRLLPGLTRGEAVLESWFDHYRPVRGPHRSAPGPRWTRGTAGSTSCRSTAGSGRAEPTLGPTSRPGSANARQFG